MRKSRFLTTVLVSSLVVAAAAQAAPRPEGPCTPPGAWGARAVFPGTIARAWGTFFPADGKFYLLGGRSADGSGFEYLQVNIYDPVADAWSASNATFADNNVNNMVGGVLDFAGTPLIVVVGGSPGTNAGDPQFASDETRTYDPAGDSLQVLTNDPWIGNTDTLTLPGGAAVYENKLFVFGGFDINIGMTSGIYSFDPSAAEGSRWSQMTSTLPTPIGYVPAATSNGLIYLFGGATWDGTTLLDSQESSVFDPDADTLTAVTTPIPRATGETRAIAAPDGTIWVLGGGRVAPNPSTEVDIYDPVGDAWTVGPAMTAARRNFAADVDPATGSVWATGGYDVDGTTLLSVNEQFTACTPVDDTIFADGFDGPPTG
jgi:Kelch motif protein